MPDSSLPRERQQRMSYIVLTFVHSHDCPDKGRVALAELPVRLDGSCDAPRVTCAHPGEFFLSELEFVAAERIDPD